MAVVTPRDFARTTPSIESMVATSVSLVRHRHWLIELQLDPPVIFRRSVSPACRVAVAGFTAMSPMQPTSESTGGVVPTGRSAPHAVAARASAAMTTDLLMHVRVYFARPSARLLKRASTSP